MEADPYKVRFEGRKPAYREGFLDFIAGRLDNPYSRKRSDREFNDSQEWEAGQNASYLALMAMWATGAFDDLTTQSH